MRRNIFRVKMNNMTTKEKDPMGFDESKVVAKEGGEVAKIAREQLESKIGKSVVTSKNAKNFLPPNT